MKLLLIDDNKALAKSLKDFLGDQFTIEAAFDGESGMRLGCSGRFDVIVLDLHLPDMEGQEVCRAIRKQGVTAPILVLSAFSDPLTKVQLFSYGADDYLTKPFHASELEARLLALQRRGHLAQATNVLTIGSLTLDPAKRRVERAGKTVELRRKEFDILEYLLRNRGRVITRPMIMDNVWDADSSSWNNTIDVHIKHLRDKVDKPFRTKLIKTVYGLGYTINDSI